MLASNALYNMASVELSALRCQGRVLAFHYDKYDVFICLLLVRALHVHPPVSPTYSSLAGSTTITADMNNEDKAIQKMPGIGNYTPDFSGNSNAVNNGTTARPTNIEPGENKTQVEDILQVEHMSKVENSMQNLQDKDRSEVEDKCNNFYTKLCGPSEIYTDLAYALERRASKEKVTLIAGSIDKAMEIFALNFFLMSIVRHSICNVLFVGIEDGSLHLVTDFGIPIYRYNRTIKHKEQGDFRSKAFKEKSTVKLRVTHEALKLGYTVLINDLDMFYQIDPFKYINWFSDYDMLVQNNTESPELVVNTGFMYITPTPSSLAFFDRIITTLDNWTGDVDDQSILNYVYREKPVPDIKIKAQVKSP